MWQDLFSVLVWHLLLDVMQLDSHRVLVLLCQCRALQDYLTELEEFTGLVQNY